jgi:NAD(P)-dependent dehydrogenase (short-subunit alcohol dehydrogenase family)
MSSLRGSAAFVTGGASGIGWGICTVLAEIGATVIGSRRRARYDMTAVTGVIIPVDAGRSLS